MEQDYKERNRQHAYNKYFFRYSQEFQCPKLERPCADATSAIMSVFLLLWIIGLPAYCTNDDMAVVMQRNDTIKGILNQDFRGDICSLNQQSRPYLQFVQQVQAPVCVSDCNSSNLCLYRADGVGQYADWCFQLTINQSNPLYGACDSAFHLINQPSSLVEQFSKLYLNVAASFLIGLIWWACSMLLCRCSLLKLVVYADALVRAFSCCVMVVIMVRNEPLDPLPAAIKYVLFCGLLFWNVIRLISTLKNRTGYNYLCNFISEFVPIMRLRCQPTVVVTAFTVIRCLICAAQVFLIANFMSTYKLDYKQSPLFPGGLIKQYDYSPLNLILLVVYLPTSLMFLNFLTYLQEYVLAFMFQVEFFSRDVRSRRAITLASIIKDLGFVYKLSIIMRPIAVFNYFCEKVQYLSSLPILKHVFLKINECLSECHEFSTKYLNSWFVNQRVFQGQSLKQGGAIVYYLIERNYPSEQYFYLNDLQFEEVSSGLYSWPSWVIWWVIWYMQTNQTEIGYVRLQYILVFVCVVQSLLLTSSLAGSFDQLLRSALYSTAANKEMRYVDRQYHSKLQQLILKFKYEPPVQPPPASTNKVQNILNFETSENIELRENEPQTKRTEPEDNVLTFRFKREDDEGQPRKERPVPDRLNYVRRGKRIQPANKPGRWK